ncbi:hypothetical protein [Rathayibacter caricis]|uniref:competence protein CoiA family protein n=1 Tax=Rathayibacter caricis TaxID=110936 RepID=UPI0011B239E9|nr:hypothetical protein [Rathayibacter caricis]
MAVAKTSPLGTQYFAHHRNVENDNHKGESADHLRVKAAVMVAARGLGWTAAAEVPAPDRSWIADVLAERDGRRVAFEVQLAGQTAEEYEYRQKRYLAAGVECVWLVRQRHWYRLHTVPAVHLRFADESISIAGDKSSEEAVGLDAFVQAILEQRVTWAAKPVGIERARLSWGVHQCYRCRKLSIIWDRSPDVTCICPGCARTEQRKAYNGPAEPKRDRQQRGLDLPAASFREADQGAGWNEPEWFCPNCQAVFFPSHLEWLYSREAATAVAAVGKSDLDPHWCVPGLHIWHPRDLVAYLAGSLSPLDAPDESETLSGAQLISTAQHRETQRKQRRDEQRAREKWLRDLIESHSVDPSVGPTEAQCSRA